MIEKTCDSEWANATDNWSDGGEVLTGANFFGNVAFDDAFFAGGAGIYDSGARAYHLVSDKVRDASGGNNYIVIGEI